ncbi:RHS repeat-associated core domain-containing protein [Bacteroides nordii]|uniref:RHS repeat-associated core domain-containing protein n=1 Tax=Bacteroides nordii TaxID=291645 RepID=UPI002A7EFAD1|nr:RHS repeat-associated core domain-containing protein [Bacteroides nordii]
MMSSGSIEDDQFEYDSDIGESCPSIYDAILRFYKGQSEDLMLLSSQGYGIDNICEYGANNVASLPIQFMSKYPDATPTFFYDANGNLYKDLNRGITGIDYNLLNLPEKITFENSSNIRYRYDADGTKLRADYKTVFNELYTPIGLPVQTSSGTLTVEHHIDYCDNLIYEDNVLKKIRVDGGYINYNPSTNNGEYCYYITDQIGSNRVILSETRGVIQYAGYYPYGIPFSEIPIEEDNFLHAGKELEKMHGLYWYDNGKRWYDPILARFTTMDPLCEKYYDKNPYSYCADNPMRYGDVNGDSIWFTFDKDVITMHVTGKVLNDSNNDVDMESAIENITTGIIRAFSGAIDGISFNVDVQLSEAKNMDGVEGSDHLFVLTDKISEIKEGEVYGASNALGGKVAFINSDYFTGPYDRMLGSRNYGTFTATHEFGHLSGLEHNKRNPFNLMRSNGSFYNLNSTQLKTVYSKWKNKELNKRYNYEINPLGRKRPNRGKASIYVRP